jgi:hypothetical protein
LSDYPATITVTPETVVAVPERIGPFQTYDEVRTGNISEVIDTQAVVTADMPVTLTNLTPEIATLDTSTGRLTRVTDGTARVNVRGGKLTRQVTAAISRSGGVDSSAFSEFAPGTLARHVTDTILGMVAGKTPSASTMDWLVGGAPNPNLFTGTLDTSGVFKGHSNGWWQGGLIAPQFGLVCSHLYGNPLDIVGNTFTCFTHGTNQAVTRTITSAVRAANDAMIVRFDSPFTGITPLKLMPVGWDAKMRPSAGVRNRMPVLKGKRVGGYKLGIDIGVGGAGIGGVRPPELNDWWAGQWVIGDSGSKISVPINNQLVFFGNGWFPSAIGSQLYIQASIIAAMDGLEAGSSATLSFVDLSAFPDTSP